MHRAHSLNPELKPQGVAYVHAFFLGNTITRGILDLLVCTGVSGAEFPQHTQQLFGVLIQSKQIKAPIFRLV